MRRGRGTRGDKERTKRGRGHDEEWTRRGWGTRRGEDEERQGRGEARTRRGKDKERRGRGDEQRTRRGRGEDEGQLLQHNKDQQLHKESHLKEKLRSTMQKQSNANE
ncbi:unnamed protein product [Calypogeia fissa]